MKRISIILLSAAASFTAACGGDSGPGGDDDQTTDGQQQQDEWTKELATRVTDYNAALRIASLRLTGDIPTLAEIYQVKNAGDEAAQKAAYEALLTQYMDRPAFAKQMMYFWRDTFKMGSMPAPAVPDPLMDQAPAFAAMLTVGNRPYTELFTATAGTCPTFNEAAGTFQAADCAGAGPRAGILTNAGVMKQFYSNFAFRRVKWIQETFDCVKFPIDLTGTAVDVGGATPYTGDYPHDSISGTANGGRVNFREAVAVQCAHCHKNLNHIAPLFANYDAMGAYQNTISVKTPLQGEPLAVRLDYLPPEQGTSWRLGVETPDMTSFGAAVAADPDVAKCGVARVWNWAMGKGDIVDLLLDVPASTIQAQIDAFTANGYKMKDLVYAIYTSDAFVKF